MEIVTDGIPLTNTRGRIKTILALHGVQNNRDPLQKTDRGQRYNRIEMIAYIIGSHPSGLTSRKILDHLCYRISK